MNGGYKERSGTERLKFRTSVDCGISGDLLRRARVRGRAHKPKFDRRSAGDVSTVLNAGGTALLRIAKFFVRQSHTPNGLPSSYIDVAKRNGLGILNGQGVAHLQ